MVLSRAQLESLQADCLADDIEIDEPRMREWTADDVRAFFESGGRLEPSSSPAREEQRESAEAESGGVEAGLAAGREVRTEVDALGRAENEAAAVESVESQGALDEVSIGDITLPVSTDPTAMELVPWLGPNVPFDLESQGSLQVLRWLMMQVALGQDMMLLTDPGPRARRLVEWLCALLGREVPMACLHPMVHA